jgi:hypothetical protein
MPKKAAAANDAFQEAKKEISYCRLGYLIKNS